MRMNNNLLFMPDPPAAGGTPPPAGGTPPPAGGTPPPAGGTPWYSTLPPEFAANPLITALKGPEDLAKGYVHAQGMIGDKRLALPKATWGEKEYNDFYKELGRPDAPDKYSESEVKLADGVTLDKSQYDTAKAQFHKLGLTDKQAKGILDFYNTGINTTAAAAKQQAEQATAVATTALRQEWGSNFDANLEIAKSVLRQFGDADAMKDIEAGLGNNPGLIKMFHKLGTSMLEDTNRTGGRQINVGSQAEATVKLATLRQDVAFQKTMNDKSAPGHKEAVALWLETHRQAASGKQKE